MDFRTFKKNQSKLQESVTNLAKAPTNQYQDDRFWSLKKDSSGNANATIRFLPQKDPSTSPILLTFRHAFKNAGKWFIDECPFTIGEKCPVCEYSQSIWGSNETVARLHWRTKSYIANIIVVSDENNPENEGKVFLYKFGKKIYDKVLEIIAPEDEDETSVNIFKFDEGLNFKLKLVQVGGYNNYDKSKFLMTPSAIADGDMNKQEAIFNAIHELAEFTDPKKFKTYDELLIKLNGSQAAKTVPPLETEYKQTEIIPEEKKTGEDDTVEDTDDIDFDALLSDDDIPF